MEANEQILGGGSGQSQRGRFRKVAFAKSKGSLKMFRILKVCVDYQCQQLGGGLSVVMWAAVQIDGGPLRMNVPLFICTPEISF